MRACLGDSEFDYLLMIVKAHIGAEYFCGAPCVAEHVEHLVLCKTVLFLKHFEIGVNCPGIRWGHGSNRAATAAAIGQGGGGHSGRFQDVTATVWAG